MTSPYECVIGLEVHVELSTASKIFCRCATAFGAAPNTLVCPVCLGYPGALPVLNREAVRYAVMAGIATHCTVTPLSRMARKHYVYPDLPKGYQISQGEVPICKDGYLSFDAEGKTHTVHIVRIHLEEDAGKLLHEGGVTRLDANRCGVPLIEIVSAPELHSGEQAAQYLKTLHALMRFIGISDCRMQEGSFRCDVNISLHKKGAETHGVRTEIKNLNSFRFAKEAIDAEIKRQSALLDRGERIESVTLRYDPAARDVLVMRRKESSADYRISVDPDLPPVFVTQEELERIAAAMPELPDARCARYLQNGLSVPQASTLATERGLSDLFDTVCAAGADAKTAATLLLSVQKELQSSARMPNAAHFAELCSMAHGGTLTRGTVKRLLHELLSNDFSPKEVVRTQGLARITDKGVLAALLREAIDADPRPLADFARGKKNAAAAYVGSVMRRTDGRADAALLGELLEETVQNATKE